VLTTFLTADPSFAQLEHPLQHWSSKVSVAFYSNSHVQAYGEQEYWEERYSLQSARFDWYMKYWAFRPLITKFSKKRLPLLHAGVGLSTFQVRSAL
jgi:hypothetical protein